MKMKEEKISVLLYRPSRLVIPHYALSSFRKLQDSSENLL
jgi:hypothetical protein